MAKRSKAAVSAEVVFDMTPWAIEFAAWRLEHAHATAVADSASGMSSDSGVVVAEESEPGRFCLDR